MPFTSRIFSLLLAIGLATPTFAQGGHSVPPPPPPGVKNIVCQGRVIPQLEDVTQKAGIRFQHFYDPEKRYIVESMSGGVIVFDYDRDGWPDIYFTNAPSVAGALKGEKARGALYHNNHDGTFTDVTDKAGIATPGYANGGAVGDYNNDGWPDLYITTLGGNVLYRNTATEPLRMSRQRPALPMAAIQPVLRSAATTMTAMSTCLSQTTSISS